uniref:CCHC-type domain-containing protein n=1 Tax=Fagus sylvatica TaxID=28930 RepID=A0A2N9IRF7_FAGSY
MTLPQMDATSNPNPNEPNPPTPTDPIIIPDEPTLPTKSQPDPSNTKELTSKVWEHFTKLGGGDLKEPRATFDNASSNDVAIDYLRRKMKLKESCIVGLRYVKSSPKRFEKFLEAVKDANIQSKSLLSLDVPTRWNSTYLMLEVAEKFERAFDRMVIDDEQYIDYFEELDGNGKKPKVLVIHMIHGSQLLRSSNTTWLKRIMVNAKTEVDQYLLEASEPPCALGFDILGWWRVNSSKYKILSHVARDVMAVCLPLHLSQPLAQGVVFWILFRNSLSPLTVEALICCQNWLRSTSSPVKLREAMDEVQSIDEELESANLFEKTAPHLTDYTPTFRGAHLVLKSWVPDLHWLEVDFSMSTFWVQIHGLPRIWQNKDYISRIGREIGSIQSIEDVAASQLYWKKFIHLRIDMDMNKPLVPGVFLPFPRRNNDDLWIGFKSEKLLEVCFSCGKIGHLMWDCSLAITTLSNQFGDWLSAFSKASPPGVYDKSSSARTPTACTTSSAANGSGPVRSTGFVQLVPAVKAMCGEAGGSDLLGNVGCQGLGESGRILQGEALMDAGMVLGQAAHEVDVLEFDLHMISLAISDCLYMWTLVGPFRFVATWTRDPRSTEIVQGAWNSTCLESPGLQLSLNHGATAAALRKWSKFEFGFCQYRIQELTNLISEIQGKPVTEENARREAYLQSDLNEWLIRNDLLWKQKSRELWLKNGDRNTKFFHLSTSLKRRHKFY